MLDHLATVAKSVLLESIEIFGSSAALSLVARSTGQWIALEPVDLVYGQDLLYTASTSRSVREQVKRTEKS